MQEIDSVFCIRFTSYCIQNFLDIFSKRIYQNFQHFLKMLLPHNIHSDVLNSYTSLTTRAVLAPSKLTVDRCFNDRIQTFIPSVISNEKIFPLKFIVIRLKHLLQNY